jgi:hypothetical protein
MMFTFDLLEQPHNSIPGVDMIGQYTDYWTGSGYGATAGRSLTTFHRLVIVLSVILIALDP